NPCGFIDMLILLREWSSLSLFSTLLDPRFLVHLSQQNFPSESFIAPVGWGGVCGHRLKLSKIIIAPA
ncbi:MAG TPA: hypothetical protein VGL94_05770, partial [Ktedonobacteraceae bacterium]